MRFHPGPVQMALGLAGIILITSAFGGCYTVLKHPVADPDGNPNFSERNCYECHGNSGPGIPYDPMHAPGFDYYGDAWYGFYAYPWWHRDIWYENRYGQGGWHDSLGYQIPVDTGSRSNLWGRGTLAPPPLPPTFTVPPGGGATGATPPASGGAPTTGDGTGPQEGRTMKHPEPPPATDGTTTPPTVTPPDPVPPPPPPPPAKDSKKDKDKSKVWGRGGSKS